MRVRVLTATLVLAGAVAMAAAALPQQAGGDKTVATPKRAKTVSADERVDALSRAMVWQAPTPIKKARLAGDVNQPREISCTFLISHLGGTAPKFDCRLPSGQRLRVKYGSSPEVPSEVASSRLLHALGFGADNVMLVDKVRCYGCPAEPFITMKTLGLAGMETLYGKLMDPADYKDFEWAAVETRPYGRAIESDEVEGWAFFELGLIDPSKGGAPRAHVDALRLLAVFLAHWDNKSENQRLVCLSDEDWVDGRPCSRPYAMLQDLGSAWGPRKVDLAKWEQAPIWADRKSCSISMDALPYHGATFTPVKISEAGRKHLGGLLSQLTDLQLDDLFRGARFDHSTGLVGLHASPIHEWVRVFKQKASAITSGPACPQ